jgi:hypothetical protein
MIPLPPKGQPITPDELINLAVSLGMFDVVETLKNHPMTDVFVSDGCSMFPDKIFGRDIYPACFRHDMRYWCGVPGDDMARLYADTELALDVAKIAGTEVARAMFIGVSGGGSGKIPTSFKWGYGR